MNGYRETVIRCDECKYGKRVQETGRIVCGKFILKDLEKYAVICRPSDGCTFGDLRPTNSMKFMELFGSERYISLLQHLKPGDPNLDILKWFQDEYKEPPCED